MKKRFLILAKTYDKKGRMLSSAYNDYKRSHPIQAYFAARVGKPHCIFLHAEIHAILRAKGKPIHRLTIERYNVKGEAVNASPCPICLEAIKAFSIKIVEHT